MKIHILFLRSALLCCILSGAHALEVTPAVKVTPFLKTTTTWGGVPIVYPRGQAEITGAMVEIAVGGETGWHEHPVPSFAVVIEGTLEVTLHDGRKNRLGPGDALAEVVDTAHNGRNVGDRPVRLAVFYAGEAGGRLTRMLPAP